MKQCPSCLTVYSEGELCTLDGTSLVQCDICEATESAEDEPGNGQLAGEILGEILSNLEILIIVSDTL